MSRVSKMTLEDILEQTNLILRENDIIYFCDNMEIAQEFISKYNRSINKLEDVKKFLIENEQYINKEKLVLILILNYQDNLNNITERMSELSRKPYEMQTNENLVELAKLNLQLKEQTARLKKSIELGRGIESFLTFYYYDEEKGRYRVEVTGADELINGKKPNNSKALKRFDEIDLSFKGGDESEKLGMEFVLQSLLLTDLYEIFPTTYFGNDIRTMILENEALRKGVISKDELEILRKSEDYEKYTTLIDNVDFQGLLPDLKLTLREYAQYMDMDKLLLISAYRFNEGLENGYIDQRAVLGAKEILQGIIENIRNKGVQISCELQTKVDNTYEMVPVTYSVKDIKKCLSRFTTNTYLTTQEIEAYRKGIKDREINLQQIPDENIEVILSPEELEELSTLSPENLMYVYKKNDWDISRIIELYEAGSISLEHIKVIKAEIDLSESVCFKKLNEYYKGLKKDSENEELLNKYNNYLSLFKEVLLVDKSAEEIQELSNFTIETIIEEFSEKEYNEVVKEYFKAGILTLDSVVEWSNEALVTSLLDEGLISLEDIEGMVRKQKLPFDYLSKIYANLIKDDEMGYDERLQLIRKGFVTEDDIIGLYIENLIFESDLRELAKEGFIREEEMKKVVESRTMEELEKNSSIRLTGLNTLTKRNNEIYSDNTYNVETNGNGKESKLIIDPNERAAFIHLFKACRAETDLEEDSPFYNYEFYVIPDESGSIGLNSVVIAERYYEEKDTESRFATKNATYFFKYKDLMVLSNLSKSEMTKERSNIVFTANHVIANEKRDGYWARSVIQAVVKTMLSSDLKEYNKENQRLIVLQKLKQIYSREEIMMILQMAEEIDSGEHICEIEEPVSNTRSKNVIQKGQQPTDSDDGSR